MSGGASQVAAPGTRALVVASESGPGASYLRATVQVTPSRRSARAAQTCADRLHGGQYSYLGNNCTTYATSILREAGVFAPNEHAGDGLRDVALQSPEVVQLLRRPGSPPTARRPQAAAASDSIEEPVSMEPPI